MNFTKNLIAAGIRPLVTLYHWDLPEFLQQNFDGWIDDQSDTVVNEFVAYADVVFAALADVGVRDWITFNEPYVFCYLGRLS